MMPPINFSKAQDLLIKLVQVLSPLTVRTIPASFFLSKRFFIPPSESELQEMGMRSSVRLLTNLTEVQKEMGEWLEEATVPSQKPEEGKEAKGKMTHSGQKLSPNAKTERDRSFLGEKAQAVSSKTQVNPISKQAQTLISQVHEAIGKLSSSSYFKDPQEEPLREALKKIKPHLDKIIELVSLEETVEKAQSGLMKKHSMETTREQLFSKIHTKTSESPTQSKELPSRQREITSERPNQPLNAQEEEVREQNQVNSQMPKHKESKVQVVNILTGKILVTQESKDEPTPRPAERTYIPGAPYQSQEKSLNPIRRKKKRKGFWFKEEEKERDHSD